jgi:predicted RND superfamily exporter protein
MGLGIDFGLHYSAHYARARATASHAQAVVETHAATLRPCLGAAGTTALAFGALAFGSVEGLRGFALLLILGLAAALLATYLILPHALRSVAPESRRGQAFVVRRFLAVARSSAGWPALLAIFGAALAGVAGIAVRGLELSTDPTRLRPPSETEARRLVEHELGVSPQPVLLLAPAAQDAGELRAGLAALRERGSVRFAEGEPGPAADRARAARVANFRVATAGWRARAERILGDLGLRPEPFAEAFVDVERRLAADPPADDAAPVAIGGEGWRQVRLFVPHSFDRIDDWRRFGAEIAATLGPRVELLAPIAWMEELATALAIDLQRAMWIAGIGCLLLLVLLLRGIGAALLAMLPAACGLATTVGALAWSGLPLTPINFIALPMLLGIGLDDGVHLVARARAGERTAGPTAAAIWRTTATTMLGFGSLVTATSPGIAELGWLTLIGVGACLLTTLLTLPILLRFGLEETA